MNATKVIHVDDMPDYPHAVYIGRAVPRRGLKASKFANPHQVKADRGLAIDMFEIDITEGPLQYLLAELPGLRSAPALACWCRRDGEDQPMCHGDILIGLLEWYTDDELTHWEASRD